MKILKDTYSVRRYEDLAFAVAHYGSFLHKQMWDLMVEAGFNRKQIFTKYMRLMRETSKINGDSRWLRHYYFAYLEYHKMKKKCLGVRHFSFQADKKSV